MARQLTQLDHDIVAWQQADQELKALKAREMDLRKKVMASAFPQATVGTNTFDLGQGYELKGVRKLNYSLTNGDNQTADALDAIEKLGNEGAFIADRLVKWKPELSITEYKALDAANPTHVKIKGLIDAVLTITDGSPELNVKEPKNK